MLQTSVLIELCLCRHPGSVGNNIIKMLDVFKMGHEIKVDRECYVKTQIATVRVIQGVNSYSSCSKDP